MPDFLRTWIRAITLWSTGLISCGPVVAAEKPPAAIREAYRRYALEHPGDPEAGQALFRSDQKLVCTNCHVITGIEKSGPNLDGIADKYSRRELIKHILEPNAFIQPGYEQVTVVTKAGKTVSGRIRLASKLEYRLLNAEGKLVRIKQGDIDELQVSQTSMMPDNLTTAVTQQQFADLVAYLSTLRSGIQTGFGPDNEPVEIPLLTRTVKFDPIHGPEQRFANPVWCTAIPGHPHQLVVVEHQEGRIWRLDRTQVPPRQILFLDLTDEEIAISPNQGLMCLAFHPRYATNRRYFVKQEVRENGRVKTTLMERQAAADGLSDSGQPARRLLELEQPAFNHNGGCLGFGPDGMLYLAFGDGGPQKDPPGYSQNPRIFHGSILRIDVDHRDDGLEYAIPADNPFVAAHRRDPAIRPETWAIGFREPWRFSFDRQTGHLWVGDVGQNAFEEVLLVGRGENHGWNVYEGFTEFSDEYRRDDAVYTPPLFAYPHSFGVSVTGGYVYRGRQAPSFQGVYVFGDYESRRVWGLVQRGGELLAIREIGRAPEHIASFGEDLEGELYLVGYEGTIYHVDLAESHFE